ncbi:MAG: hypothetical protein COS99_00175 [Candidatus Omnitrophica bacterium CG07_land_8_20_14_0_80_42_15]|uniref:Uncharacterized protein n=1 Tax=Candidatus Aquitaenariimonas noxiae TaxID=1974741 RepID=A0A2J0KVE0_9BACT|nr:MAG: hypothetical protein COS99_00175 [Candidatus Omnitrophica bacterium CG07_land_8_20_14_0_80_42_15]
MDETAKQYFNQQRHGAIVSKNYVHCPKCNTINLLAPKDIICENEHNKYYHIICQSCKEGFDT